MAKSIAYNLTTGETTETEYTPVEPSTDYKWSRLRQDRDRLLAETDVWALSDRSITAAQTKYRQDLRDLPANTSDPANPTWPSKP